MPIQTSEPGASKVRKRLLQLVGSDEIHINDRDFMTLLQTRLDEEYTKHLTEKEKQLQEQERKRSRRLILDGLIDPALEESDEKKSDAKGSKPVIESWEVEHFPPNPAQLTYREQLEHVEPNETEGKKQEKEDQTKETEDEVKAENEEETGKQGEEESSPQKVSDSENATTEKGGEEPSDDSQASKRYRPYSARMERFEEEETITGLYDLAKELVYMENAPSKKK